MQFMAVVRRRTEDFSAEEFEKYLEAEAEALRTLYIAGTVRNAWSRGDLLGAILHLEADSLEHAEQIIASLPLAQRNMLDCQMLIPLRGYRGFGPRS